MNLDDPSSPISDYRRAAHYWQREADKTLRALERAVENNQSILSQNERLLRRIDNLKTINLRWRVAVFILASVLLWVEFSR